MKTIILCGGKGIRVGNQSTFIPKAMVKIGHRPIIWHIMKRYSLYDYNDFILALGEKGEQIRDYFTKYDFYSNDIEVNLGSGKMENLTSHQESNWRVKLVDTGDTAMSGARVARCKQYVEDDENFMVSYSDCLANIDIDKLISFHKTSKKIATITGAIPPYREGEFIVKNSKVSLYNSQKEEQTMHYVNGGYMVFKKDIFSYLSSFNECKLESEVFPKLVKDKQISIFPHLDFWRWLDTERDYGYLNELADKNKMHWLYE